MPSYFAIDIITEIMPGGFPSTFMFCILRIRNSKRKSYLSLLKNFHLKSIKIAGNLVLAISNGIELKAVTKPDIIDAPKCKPTPSFILTIRIIIFQIIKSFKRDTILEFYKLLQTFVYFCVFLEINITAIRIYIKEIESNIHCFARKNFT